MYVNEKIEIYKNVHKEHITDVILLKMSLHIVFLLFRIMSKTTYQKKNMNIFCFPYVQVNQRTVREIKTCCLYR